MMINTIDVSKQRKLGAMLSYINIALNMLVAVAYTPVMLRLLGQSEYGLYSLSSSIISYLGLLGFGLSSGYIRFYSLAKAKNDKTGIAKLNGMFLLVLSAIALIAFIAGCTIALNLDFVMNHKLSLLEMSKMKIMVFLLSVNLALSFPSELVNAYATVHECFVFQRLLQIAQTTVKPIVTIPLLLMGYASVGMTVVAVFVHVSAMLILTWFCLKNLKMQFVFASLNWSLFGEIVVFSSYIFMNFIVDRVNWSVDSYLIGIFHGTAAVGIYSVAALIVQQYNGFSTAVSNVFVPKVNMIVSTTNDNKELTELFTKVGRVQFYIIALILICFVFLGHPFIVMWAGKNYSAAYLMTLLLVVPVTIPLVQNLGIEIQRAKNMHKFRSVVYTLMAGANLLISIPLCKVYGGVGAAAGTALSLILANGFIMNWYYHFRIKIDVVYFWRGIADILPALFPPVFAGIVLVKFFNTYCISHFLLGACLLVCVYIASVWLFAFNDFEKNLVLPFIRKIAVKAGIIR